MGWLDVTQCLHAGGNLIKRSYAQMLLQASCRISPLMTLTDQIKQRLANILSTVAIHHDNNANCYHFHLSLVFVNTRSNLVHIQRQM